MIGSDPVIGRVVYSKAGRDKGKVFIIIGIVDEDFVLIADGDIRPAEKPKKKRIKHLKVTDRVAESIADKLAGRRRVQNADLKAAISEIQKIVVSSEG